MHELYHLHCMVWLIGSDEIDGRIRWAQYKVLLHGTRFKLGTLGHMVA